MWATAPFGIYETSDGHIAIAMTPCPVLAEALDLSFLAQFDTLDKMVESRAEIYAHLAAHLLGGTSEHWIEILLEHDVWCAPVQAYDRLDDDPQVAHNGCSGTCRSATARRRSARRDRRSRSRGRPRDPPRRAAHGQHTAELFPDQA